MANILTWQTVDDAAAELGASQEARLKWRQRGRGVPPAWQIKLANHFAAKGRPVDLAAFASLPETPGRIAA